MDKNRRKSIKQIGTGMVAVPAMVGIGSLLEACGGSPKGNQEAAVESTAESPAELFFTISLAQWSLNKSFFGKSRELGWEKFTEMRAKDPDSVLMGDIDPLDFPVIARNTYGISAVEYVNQFFPTKAQNMEYLGDLKSRADGEGVRNVLIMIDGEGGLGNLDDQGRMEAVENHYKWVDAAKYLGCHSIRVNAYGEGTSEEVASAAIDGLGRLSEYGAQNEIGVIVENHGGYSSDGQWLSNVIKSVGNDYCGTLPDLGNFCIERGEDGCAVEYDKYKGTEELMPFAKGVSAKTHAFDAEGNEAAIDYRKMLTIVKNAGFNGFIGIEYEGSELSEDAGIKATKTLLERIGGELS